MHVDHNKMRISPNEARTRRMFISDIYTSVDRPAAIFQDRLFRRKVHEQQRAYTTFRDLTSHKSAYGTIRLSSLYP